ncbi:MAG: aminopeptidase P N-terminal domain-containing protein, partial [Myxococcales bacterium]|nr:aminopeptidase P N-terminal domain-containing protein [Myxococcales bacterium]
MELPAETLRDACVARRSNLAARLGGVTAVIPAGRPVPRNYPANPHWPFRASSHFLYLVGASIEDAVLVVHRGESTLCLPQATAEDALWHGAPPSMSHLAHGLGLGVAPLAELPALLKGRTVGALPPPDAQGQAALEALGPRAADAQVADAIIDLRLRHDAAAVGGLERAAEATVAAHRVGMAATRPGIPAWQVVGAMMADLAHRGMGTSYPPIVSPRGEVLHNHAHHDVLAAGDLLLADVGAETR